MVDPPGAPKRPAKVGMVAARYGRRDREGENCHLHPTVETVAAAAVAGGEDSSAQPETASDGKPIVLFART